jgi:hypothetical protein
MEKLEYTVTDFHAPPGKCRGTIADLVLDALVIPQCGLIPPFRVLQKILRSGGGDAGMSPGCIWEPFELTEADYWRTVQELEGMTAADFKLRHRDPQIQGEIRSDDEAPDTVDYGVWMQSLVHRGYLPGGAFKSTRR